MPDFVARSKNKDPYVLSVPEGAEDQLDERVAALGPDWALDKKTDPALIVPGEQSTPTPKEK